MDKKIEERKKARPKPKNEKSEERVLNKFKLGITLRNEDKRQSMNHMVDK